MPSAPLPPYGAIVFIVLFVIVAVLWLIQRIGRKNGNDCMCCSCCSGSACCASVCCDVPCGKLENELNQGQNEEDQEELRPSQQQQQQNEGAGAPQVVTSSAAGGGGADADNNNNYGAANQTQNQQEQNSNGVTKAQEQKEAEEGCGMHLLRVVILLCGSALIAFLLTCLIFGSLAASGFVDTILFSPTSSTACVSSCPTHDTRGLTGHADETCCSYTDVAALGEKFDFYLQLQDAGSSAKSAYTVSGWLLVNRTRHYSAPTTQLPLLIMYNHGSGGNIAMQYRHERYKFLLAQGNVMIVTYDYPGYGKSTGAASATSVMASASGVARWMLANLAPKVTTAGLAAATFSANLGTAAAPSAVSVPAGGIANPTLAGADLSKLVVLGRSMGVTAVSYLTRYATAKPKAIVIQSGFYDLKEIVEYYLPMFYFLFTESAEKVTQFDNAANLAAAAYTQCGYVFFSESDEWVPASQTQALAGLLARTWTAACSQTVISPAAEGTIHTQPLTERERTTLASFLGNSALRS